MIFCVIGGNVVLADPMTKKSEGAIVQIHQKFIRRLNDAGIFPKKNILDNEIFKRYKEAIGKNVVTWELVPVGMHWRNMAEKQDKLSKDISNLLFVGLPKTFQ